MCYVWPRLPAGCTQQDAPSPEASPALRATNIPEAIPTLEPTDRSAPPPTTQPTDTPTSNPAGRPTHTPEAVPTPESTNTAEPDPASQATDTPEPEPVPQTTIAPLDCVGLFPTSTPDPNRPEVIPGRFSEFWTVSSYEEAECITGYPIYVPSNLPDGFIRNDNIFAVATGTEYFEDRYVELGWHLPGDPAYGFMLSQHSWPFGIDGEPAMINGILGERYLRPAIPPDLPPLLVFFWEEDGYWFTISGFLGGPITEELLLEVAASLQPRVAATGIDTTTVSQECSALDPTSTPDPNRPEGILGRDYQFWNVSSFEEAECITDYPIAIPTNLPRRLHPRREHHSFTRGRRATSKTDGSSTAGAYQATRPMASECRNTHGSSDLAMVSRPSSTVFRVNAPCAQRYPLTSRRC